jgi:hypothetical protein
MKLEFQAEPPLIHLNGIQRRAGVPLVQLCLVLTDTFREDTQGV